MTEKNLLTAKQCVEKIGPGIDTRLLWRMVHAGQFPKPTLRYTRRTAYWLDADVDAWIAALARRADQ